MALDTRLIGQALGTGKGRVIDTSNVTRAVMRGEQAILRTKAQEQRRKELQAQAIAQLPQLDESKVPMQMREWAIGQALEARNVALNAIRNKDIDPVERQMAISNAQQSISKIAAKTNDFKQWIAQFADTQPDDLSKLNSPELMERVNDIYSGKFKVSGDQFVFEDGTVKDFDSLITTRHISRRSDAYTSQLQALGSEYEKYGLQGWDEKAFESKIDNELNSTKYTDADLASIAVDELGLPASEIKAIQDDFEDNGILDSVNKEALIAKIKDQYKTAARSAYDNARRLYEEKTKPKPTKPESLDKWEFDELMRKRDLRATAAYLKPISKFLSSKPISETEAKSLIDYANTNIPGIEIYQNTQTNDDGELLNPNAYVIEVNGKQKPFIIGETSGSAIDKFIKDLYGYSTTDRLTMFGAEVDADSNTSTKKETPQEKISNAGLKQPEMIKEGEYPEEYSNLSEEPISAAEKRKIGDQRIVKRINKDYQGVFSKRNIAEVEYDLYGRDKENEERQKNFINENKNISILENLKKEFETASDNRLSEKTRNSFSIKERKLIEEFIGKPIARITEKEFIQYKYNFAGGDLANLEEDKYSQYKEG